MVEDIVDVTTNIVIQDAGNGKNFQVYLMSSRLKGQTKTFLSVFLMALSDSMIIKRLEKHIRH